MDDDQQKRPEVVLEALKGSGFPFQTAVEHEIIRSRRWAVHASEYPWRSQREEFLDIIASNEKVFLTIECKKTRKETWTFLRPGWTPTAGNIKRFRCVRPAGVAHGRSTQTLVHETWDIEPESRASQFCVVSTSKNGRDQRMLERDAGLLISGTDAFALAMPDTLVGARKSSLLILPVIVTNARLFSTRYAPGEISLETGEFPDWPSELEEERWIRFSKSFTASAVRDVGERSIFVVRAVNLADFLQTLNFAEFQLGDKNSVSVFTR